MNAGIETLPVNSANTKPLWAAVGVLGVAVLAMGASLVYVQTRPADTHAAMVAMAPAIETEVAPPAKAPPLEAAVRQDEVAAPAKAPVIAVKPVPVKPKPVHAPAPAAPAVVATTEPAPAPVAAPVVVAAAGTPQVIDHGVVVRQPAKPICANCGTIEAVTPIQRNGEAKGVGAVAGGVLGAVVGNQIGHGGGRTAATILGALGGGLAGNAIEKNVRKETVYQVRVRMEDGSTRTIEQASLPSVGARVVVEGNAMHSTDGNRQAPSAANQQPLPQTQSTQVFNRT